MRRFKTTIKFSINLVNNTVIARNMEKRRAGVNQCVKLLPHIVFDRCLRASLTGIRGKRQPMRAVSLPRWDWIYPHRREPTSAGSKPHFLSAPTMQVTHPFHYPIYQKVWPPWSIFIVIDADFYSTALFFNKLESTVFYPPGFQSAEIFMCHTLYL